jgi:hypothetical protein
VGTRRGNSASGKSKVLYRDSFREAKPSALRRRQSFEQGFQEQKFLRNQQRVPRLSLLRHSTREIPMSSQNQNPGKQQNQNPGQKPGQQQNQNPNQKPGQQQGGGQKPGQQQQDPNRQGQNPTQQDKGGR